MPAQDNHHVVRWVAIIVMVLIAGFSGFTTWSQQAFHHEMESLRSKLTVESALVTSLRIQTAVVMTTMEQLREDVRDIKEMVKKYVSGE